MKIFLLALLFLRTPEDQQNQQFFAQLYEKNSELTASAEVKIPRVFHVVWLGPSDFPKSSVKNIQAWIDRHPGWTFKFWTDQERSPPCKGMEVVRVGAVPDVYHQSDNFGEKSEILRYEILLREGGVYVDHDTTPLQSLEALQHSYDFYCSLEKEGPSILSSSIFPGTHLLAARPGHPVLKEALTWLEERFDSLEMAYPGSTPEAVFNRVKHRSFSALAEGVRRGIDRPGCRDIVFPEGLLAQHQHAGTWHKVEDAWEEETRQKLEKIAQKQQLVFWLMLGVCASSLLFFVRSKKVLPLLILLAPLSLSASFEEWMGKNTPHFDHLQQEIDLADFQTYQALYEKNEKFLNAPSSQVKIPHVVHFIWLGPRPFPPQSVENVRTWLAQNPGWTVKFWTDRERDPPCSGMQRILVRDFAFTRLGQCYEQSQNWGEKSDILRYEILFQEGGVYVDHDANCLKPFDNLHSGYDFYCGLETPHPPFVQRNLTCGNGVIGARPGHPTTRKVIDLIAGRWESLGQNFPGKDGFSRTQLVMQRTYIALTHALKGTIDQAGNVDIVLPAAYFFSKKGIPALYSQHFYANAWADDGIKRPAFEKELEKRLGKIEQKSKNLQWLCLAVIALQLAFLFYRRSKCS
jgi:mannosyltransferase OCH1-like enzyme